ncbi:MAG: DUF3422 domain-containing protein [Rhodospirillales bacterium]
MKLLREHDLRRRLADEAHARPFQPSDSPVRVTHLAMVQNQTDQKLIHSHLGELCGLYDIRLPPMDARHFSADFGDFRLRWERHTEYSSYTLTVSASEGAPFSETALSKAPEQWIENMPGRLIAGGHLEMQRDDSRLDLDQARTWFGGNPVIGADMAGGRATCWTDFQLHSDGFGRILVRDRGMSSGQTGRLIQRLFEIDTYRMMAMMALPDAQLAMPRIVRIDRELNKVTTALTESSGADSERQLLDRLSRLAAMVESIGARSGDRFSAAEAYYAIVEVRVRELREARIEGLQTIEEFMDRRLAPAMRTVVSTSGRLSALSARIARASDLLQARIDVALEAQNRDLLASMDRRAKLQLRLQETVEGLSVAAITYYAVGLVSYLAKGLHASGLPVNYEIVTAVAVPVIALLAWFGVRRIRRKIGAENQTAEAGD